MSQKGRRKKWAATLGYDNDDRLTSISHTSSVAGALAAYSYTLYDAAGQLKTYTGPEGDLTDGYDTTSQLTSVSGARAENYTYDLNGNRTMALYRLKT